VILLFNDIVQNSDAPPPLKSPALTETTTLGLTVSFENEVKINAIGIGNTDGTTFHIEFSTGDEFDFEFNGNGLYQLNKAINTTSLTLSGNGTFIGRLGAGIGIHIPTSIAKQHGWSSTSKPLTTLSGQVIPGLGGYVYRTLSLDSRYKINSDAMKEIEAGYLYLGAGYPVFIDLSDESYKLPFSKLYATDRNQTALSFEGGITRYLYSRRWEFAEAF
jgi:hypothetical protein